MYCKVESVVTHLSSLGSAGGKTLEKTLSCYTPIQGSLTWKHREMVGEEKGAWEERERRAWEERERRAWEERERRAWEERERRAWEQPHPIKEVRNPKEGYRSLSTWFPHGFYMAQ